MALEQLMELQLLLEGESTVVDVVDILNELGLYLLEGEPFDRQDVVDMDGYQTIIQAWAGFCDTGEFNVRVLWKDTEEIREACMFALSALTFDQPDIMDQKGYAMLFQSLDYTVPVLTRIYGLNTMRNISYGGEDHREALVSEYKLIAPFARLIKRDSPEPELVQAWSETLRGLTLYDDPNEGYAKSIERRKMVFLCDVIHYLVNFLTEFRDDYETLSCLLNSIGILSRTGLHCVGIEKAGALPALDSLFPLYASDTTILKKIINCLKNLSSSVEVREKINGTGIIKNLINACWEHKDNPAFVELSISTLAYMTRKVRCNITQAMTERAISYTINFMNCYNDNVNIMKGCCLLIQNIARFGGSIGRKTILDIGAEPLLRAIMEQYQELAEHHVKPALRDLGFEVEFIANGVEGEAGENDEFKET